MIARHRRLRQERRRQHMAFTRERGKNPDATVAAAPPSSRRPRRRLR